MTTTALDPDKVFSISQAVFQDFLGLSLAWDVPDDADELVADGLVSALIHLTGVFHGGVMVQVGQRLAVEISAAMFMVETDELGEDEIRDAFGEVANMLAGSVRSELDLSANLSLPTVCVGEEYEVWIPGSHIRDRLDCACLGKRLSIVVWEQD